MLQYENKFLFELLGNKVNILQNSLRPFILIHFKQRKRVIKPLTPLVSLSVAWENGPAREFNTFSINLYLPVNKANSAGPDQTVCKCPSTNLSQGFTDKRQVSEKSRECHNYEPQTIPDPKRKRKPTKPNKHKSKKRNKSTKISSFFPKQGNRNAKKTEKHKNKIAQGKT